MLQFPSMNPNEMTKAHSNESISIISVAIFILLALGTIIFLFNQNQKLKSEIAVYRIAQTPEVIQSPTPSTNMILISSPSASPNIKKVVVPTGSPISTSSAGLPF